MAKNVSKQTRGKGWFKRYKVSSVLLGLVLIVLVYWGVETLVWRAQVHSERVRYEKAAADIHALAADFPAGGEVKEYKQCSYTSNGAVFATRFLGCQINLYSSYPALSAVEAQKLTSQEIQVLVSNKLSLTDNRNSYDANDFANYSFEKESINCGFFATYYSAMTEKNMRDSHVSQQGEALLMGIECSGPTKAAYFPVVKD